MDGGNLKEILTDSDKAKLQEILQHFGLQEQFNFIVENYKKILNRTMSVRVFQKLLIGKGSVTQQNAGEAFKAIDGVLTAALAAPAAVFVPAEPKLDVSSRYETEDNIFHALLDYLKSFKFAADRERRMFNVFLSYEKGLRDEFETQEALRKDEIRGGCALNPTQVDEAFKKFQEINAELLQNEFDAKYVSSWFTDHYDSVMLKKTSTGAVQELTIDTPKEASAGEHQLVSLPDHDYNMPLEKHIDYHFKEVNAEPEILAPVIPKQISKPAVVQALEVKPVAPKVIPAVASQSNGQPTVPTISPAVPKPEAPAAPLPSRTFVKPADMKTTNEMVSVEKKPVMAPVFSDELRPVRTVPPQLTQMIDHDVAGSIGEQAALNAISKPKKQGMFSRLFAKKPVVSSKPSVPAPSAPTINAIPTVDGRPQMTDVVFTPKLVTPTDELQSLTLADFRRLSKDPLVAIKKIEDKLNLLAQESLKKKADGIEALKKSGLYSDYSAIMSESVMQGVSYTQVIAKRKTLTEEEYKALMQLNKQLRS